MLKYGVKWICILGITGAILCDNKVISSSVLAVFLSTSTPTPLLDVKKKPRQITWYKSFEKGLTVAKREQKPLLVDFEANWCIWCKRLDSTTYKAPQVITLSKRFICVKVNCDVDSVTAQRYGVLGLPTIIFMNSEGKVIHQVIGYRGPEDFASEMQKVLISGK